jgi:hypothetical protein
VNDASCRPWTTSGIAQLDGKSRVVVEVVPFNAVSRRRAAARRIPAGLLGTNDAGRRRELRRC